MNPPTQLDAWLELPDGTIFWLQSQCKIGRRKEVNDLVLDVPLLSREHAQIDSTPHGFRLTDVGSSNGTLLNQHPLLRPAMLKDSDSITLGNVSLRFRTARQEAVPSADDCMQTTKKLDAMRTANCWLLLADIEGYSLAIEQLGSELALKHLQSWITDVRPCIEHNGGTINSYVGDAIFAYWRMDLSTPEQVLAALRELEAHRSMNTLAYRIVVHQGFVLFTQSERGEELSSQDINFVFRSEKIAKRLHCRNMLSQNAVGTLGLEGRCDSVGTSPVDGITGLFAFFSAPAEVLQPTGEKPGCRILLVEESSVLSDGFLRLLETEPGLKVCERAQHGPTIRRLQAKHQPDLVIIDLAVRSSETLSLIQDLTQAAPHTHILVLTTLNDLGYVERALRAGALGYVLKTDPTAQVLEAIRTVAQGGMFLSRQIAAPALRLLTGSTGERITAKQGPGSLSDREMEVFRLIGLGQPNRDIAIALGISVKTVETHRENIKLKLKLSSAAELAATAKQWAEDVAH